MPSAHVRPSASAISHVPEIESPDRGALWGLIGWQVVAGGRLVEVDVRLHESTSVPRHAIRRGCCSRPQRRCSAPSELEARITPRYSELRVDHGFLKVVASDAPLAHGLTPSLVPSSTSCMHIMTPSSTWRCARRCKRPDSRMVTISTGIDALGRFGAIFAGDLWQAYSRPQS